MGTRATITIKDKNKTLVTLYRQFDGYVEGGLGDELIKFCKPFRIVNGFSFDDRFGEVANGMGCFAAQLIVHLKKSQIGNVYIIDNGNSGEEYNYTISEKNGKLELDVEGNGEILLLLSGKIDKETLPLVMFMHESTENSPSRQRIVRVTEQDDDYIKGYDENSKGEYRQFSKFKIIGKVTSL